MWKANRIKIFLKFFFFMSYWVKKFRLYKQMQKMCRSQGKVKPGKITEKNAFESKQGLYLTKLLWGIILIENNPERRFILSITIKNWHHKTEKSAVLIEKLANFFIWNSCTLESVYPYPYIGKWMHGFAVVEFRVLQVPSIDTARAVHLFFCAALRMEVCLTLVKW